MTHLQTPVQKLNDRHIATIDEYMVNGFRKAEAMVVAGYKESYARRFAWAFFKQPLIREEIEKRRRMTRARVEVTEQRIVQEYAKIAFASFGDYVTIDEDGYAHIDLRGADDDMMAAIGEYTVESYMEKDGDDIRTVKKAKFKLSDKKAALDSLARHLGMFKDRIEVDGEVKVVEALQAARKRLGKPDDGRSHVTPGDDAKVINGVSEEVDA